MYYSCNWRFSKARMAQLAIVGAKEATTVAIGVNNALKLCKSQSPTQHQQLHAAVSALAASPWSGRVCFAMGRDVGLIEAENLSENSHLFSASTRVPKRMTCLCAHPAGGFVGGAANGDVLHFQRGERNKNNSGFVYKLLCAHTACSVSSVACDAGSQLLATGDVDGRIRVSRMPQSRDLAAHVIESFCLGHTGAVTSLAFSQHDTAGLLLASACDCEYFVRIWNPWHGIQLAHAHTAGLVRSLCAPAQHLLLVLSSSEDSACRLDSFYLKSTPKGEAELELLHSDSISVDADISSIAHLCSKDGYALAVSSDGGTVYEVRCPALNNEQRHHEMLEIADVWSIDR